MNLFKETLKAIQEFDAKVNGLSARLDVVEARRDANRDGTISPDEDRRVEALVSKARAVREELKREAYEIGGSFRGPGYWNTVLKELAKR